jgi:hypothetical protein
MARNQPFKAIYLAQDFAVLGFQSGGDVRLCHAGIVAKIAAGYSRRVGAFAT